MRMPLMATRWSTARMLGGKVSWDVADYTGKLGDDRPQPMGIPPPSRRPAIKG